MSTFEDARAGLAKFLKDKPNRLSKQEKDLIIVDAVRQFQRRVPQILAREVAGDGGFDYALPTDFVFGFSKIQRIYFPFDPTFQDPTQLEPKDYEIFKREAGEKLRFKTVTPGASEQFLILFSAPHDADPNGSVDVIAELSPVATVVNVAATSTEVDTESAADARVFISVAGTTGGTLFVYLQVEDDAGAWYDIGVFNEITAAGDYVEPLRKHRVGKAMRLRYDVQGGGAFTLTARLEREGTDGSLTVRDDHMDLLSMLAAALCGRALADYYAGTSDNEMSGDTTDYQSKSTFWSDLADKWEEAYQKQLDALPKEGPVTAFAQGEWDIKGSTGYRLLVHQTRDR